MLSNPFHVYIMLFQGVFGKKNPDNGIYVHAFTGIKNSWSALVNNRLGPHLGLKVPQKRYIEKKTRKHLK